MFTVEIPRIPAEGLVIDAALDVAALHLEGDSEFLLRPGGRLVGRIEIVDGTTVHVRGRLSGIVEPECGRCLARYAVPLEQELDLFYLPRGADSQQAEEEEVELSDRDVVVGYYDGDRLELGEVVREQLFLALPLRRICREDCPGLCQTCGARREEGDCGCPPAEEPEDSRLAPLRRLFDKD